MNSIELEERAALDAVGALSDEERELLREQLAAADPGVQAAVAQMYDSASALAVQAVGTVARGPSPGLRDRLMARVSTPGSFSVLTSDGQWLETPIAGLMMKVLSLDHAHDSAVLLMRARPGVRYPPHHHSGAEECYVVSGEVRVQGRVLHAGDFHHAEPGSDHDELYTETGAEVLLVVAASDYGL